MEQNNKLMLANQHNQSFSKLGIQTTGQHNLTNDDRGIASGNGGIGDYSDFNINNPL